LFPYALFWLWVIGVSVLFLAGRSPSQPLTVAGWPLAQAIGANREGRLLMRGAGGVRGTRGLPPRSRAGASAMMRAAAVLAWFAGLGFGLPCTYAIWYFADRGDVWTFLGFPTYGGGPFENIGIKTTVPLLVLFLLVCVAELGAGWLLWHHRRAGAVLALALLPAELAFWIGFALPAGPALGLARTVLVLLGWSSLSQRKAQPTGRPAESPATSQRPPG
jgi:hypothetical protein